MTWRARMQSRNPGAKRSTCASIAAASRRSTRAARGNRPTQCAARSARARGRTACAAPAARTDVRHAGLPTRHARMRRSPSSVPPTCTVAARLHGSAVHGIGDASAQSTLNTPMLYRYRSSFLRYAAGRRWPAIRRNGARRQIAQDRAGVRQLVDGTLPAYRSQPLRRATAGAPRAHRPGFARPPRGNTHPARCAVVPSTSPERCRDRVLSGSIPCAASPGKERARVGVGERARRESGCRPDRTQPEPRETQVDVAASAAVPAVQARGAPNRPPPDRSDFRYARASMPSRPRRLVNARARPRRHARRRVDARTSPAARIQSRP